MNSLVEINNTTLGIKEYNGQRVITFKDIDKVHERPDGTARRNFNSNKKHMIENVDYFKITRNMSMDEIRTLNITIPPKGTTLLTESGYLLLVKSFNDDLAWQVQRQLVNIYFRSKETIQETDNLTEKLIETFSSINDRLTKLEEKQNQQLESPKYKKPYNPWFAKMKPKYTLLEDYFNVTRGELYKQILYQMENLYGVDTQQIQADYCYENNILSCYPLEPYEFNQKYRTMIEAIVNDNLIKYGIASEDDPITSTKHITIFDRELIAKEVS